MKTILIVSDAELYRYEVKKCLVNHSFEVLIRSDVEKAINTLKKVDIDLIVVDIPDQNRETFFLMRTKQINSDMPIVVVTNNPSFDMAIKTLRLGAVDYIQRQFCAKTLLGTIEERISNIEDFVLIIQSELRWCDDTLQQLRLSREIAETKCFREMLKLHRKILGIKNR